MMKKSILFLLFLFPLALMIIFILFLFSLPATYGIFKWNENYKNLLLKICILPIIISLFGFISFALKNKKKLNKVFSLISLILNILFLTIISGAFIYIILNSSPSFDKLPPIMIMLPTTGSYGIPNISINLKTENKQQIELYYTISKDENEIDDLIFENTIKEKTKSYYHKFVITDLQPDSFYYFKLSTGELFKYKTPKIQLSDASPFIFSASSDPHFGREESRNDLTKQIALLIQKDKDNSFFGILGDFVESGYIKSQWEIASDFLSNNVNKLPIIPVMGNHDAFVGGHRFYKYIFTQVKAENSISPFYNHYTFKLENKNIHIINLSLLWGVEDFSIKQRSWLIKELSKISKDDFVIILSHAFIYASGYTEEGGIPWFDNISAIKTLEPIFKKYDVDLVISGHNHTMELIENDSIYYAIIGSFGGLPDQHKTFTSEGSIWYDSGKFGYLKVKSFINNFILSFYNENDKLLFEKICNY